MSAYASSFRRASTGTLGFVGLNRSDERFLPSAKINDIRGFRSAIMTRTDLRYQSFPVHSGHIGYGLFLRHWPVRSCILSLGASKVHQNGLPDLRGSAALPSTR